LGFIRTLVDRTNNNWVSFDSDLKSLSNVMARNSFSLWLFKKTVKVYLNKMFTVQEQKYGQIDNHSWV